MAEPPASTAARPSAGGADVLLATRLYVPRLPPGFVSRPRLAARFAEGLARGLLLDAGDNDPARFWRHVIAAVDRVAPQVARQVEPLLGPSAPPPPGARG